MVTPAGRILVTVCSMKQPEVPILVDQSDAGEYAGNLSEPHQAAHRAVTPWRRATVIAAAGVPVGLIWWLLAPSGFNLLTGDPELASGTNISGWLPRDLVLAGLFLLAGSISGALVSGSKDELPGPWAIVFVVLAGTLGAVLAWGTGVLAGQRWGESVDAETNASVAFSLRSYAIIAIWPAAIALSIFLETIFRTPARARKMNA